MYVCSCFGITDKQVKDHAANGACTPRQIASVTKAGTDCGSCVRTIQGLLGRGACPRRELVEKGEKKAVLAADPVLAESRPALAESRPALTESRPAPSVAPLAEGVPEAELAEAA